MSESPIFVVGVPRSGTTLVRYVLNSSGRTHIPPESGFIPRLFGRRPFALVDRNRARRLIGTIFDEYRFVSQWRSDRPTPTLLLGDASAVTPGQFLDALYREYARQYGAVRWGDKTPIYTNHLDLLARIFPDGRFVHVIRDGRDVVVSTLEKWADRKRHIDVYYAARNWAMRAGRARDAGRRLGADRYLEVRYEELVADPEPVIRGICEFLEEPFVATMLEPHVVARRQLPPGLHEAVRHPVTTTQVGRWHRDLDAADLRVVERVAGTRLASFGYRPDMSTEMSGRERLRYAGFAAKYAVSRAGRRTLQFAGVFGPN